MSLNQKYKKAKGQITVFLALVFFVMFSLFGMTISMGMFIHDKINLQNSTDLASYYVAAKQAELLGAIAHSNYQIRQSWKLLAFRYRVLGNAARTDNGQMSPGITKNPDSHLNSHNVYKPSAFQNGKPPRVCMGSAHVFKEVEDDNLCKEIDFKVSYIPRVPKIINLGIISATNTTIDSTNKVIANQCSAIAYLNWWYANTIVGTHKLEQRDRRAIIEALAENLAKPIAAGGMKDLDGRDVFEGAEKTFKYNLTDANRLDGNPGILFRNSLEEKKPSDWLSTIYINTIVPWSFYDISGDNCGETVFNHPEDTELQKMLNSGTANTKGARGLRQVLDASGRIKGFGVLDPGETLLWGFLLESKKSMGDDLQQS